MITIDSQPDRNSLLEFPSEIADAPAGARPPEQIDWETVSAGPVNPIRHVSIVPRRQAARHALRLRRPVGLAHVGTRRVARWARGRTVAVRRLKRATSLAFYLTAVERRRSFDVWVRGLDIPPMAVIPRSTARRWMVPFACGIAAGTLPWLVNTGAAPNVRSTTVSLPGRVLPAAALLPPPALPRFATVAGPAAFALVPPPEALPQGRVAANQQAGRVQIPAAMFRGSVIVNSVPQGARVFFNGRSVGTTPLSLADQPVGSRAVRVELDGYQAWTLAVRVVANERALVNAGLIRTPVSQEALP